MDAIEKAAFHPGEYLKDELDAREWTQTELAKMIGRPLRLINRIIVVQRLSKHKVREFCRDNVAK